MGRSIDTDIRLSTASDQIEIVSLNAGIPRHGCLAMHEIQRHKDAKCSAPGQARGMEAAVMQGRFVPP